MKLTSTHTPYSVIFSIIIHNNIKHSKTYHWAYPYENNYTITYNQKIKNIPKVVNNKIKSNDPAYTHTLEIVTCPTIGHDLSCFTFFLFLCWLYYKKKRPSSTTTLAPLIS